MEKTNHHFQTWSERIPPEWMHQYQPQSHIDVSVYNNLMHLSKYAEWLRIVNNSPNGIAAGPTGITYEMITFGSTLWNCHR